MIEIRKSRLTDAPSIANIEVAFLPSFVEGINQISSNQRHLYFNSALSNWLRLIRDSRGEDILVADDSGYGVVAFASLLLDQPKGLIRHLFALETPNFESVVLELLKGCHRYIKECGSRDVFIVLENDSFLTETVRKNGFLKPDVCDKDFMWAQEANKSIYRLDSKNF